MELLYKYIGLADGGLPDDRRVKADFLKDSLFRFTQPNQLNDPFEVRPRIRMKTHSIEDKDQAREKALDRGFKPHQIDEKVIEMFLTVIPGRMTPDEFPGLAYPKRPGTNERFRSMDELDEYRAEERLNQVLKNINETYGLFCLTTSRTNLVMWSHYAAGHKGMVIGFDAEHPFFQKSQQLHRVDYQDERISLSSIDGYLRLAGKPLQKEEDFKNLATNLFLRKHPDWEYEQEWRMIKDFKDADKRIFSNPTVYLFRIPREAIKLIIRGAEMSAEDKELIDNLRDSSPIDWTHLTILQASLHDSSFGLVFADS